MNGLVEIIELKNEINIKKSAYRSIIYLFSGELTVLKSQKKKVLKPNEYIVIKNDVEYSVTLKENSEGLLLYTCGLEFCNEDKVFYDDVGSLGDAIKYAKLYLESSVSNDKRVSEAFYGVIEAIIGGFFPSGKNATVERIKDKITENFADPDFDLPEYLSQFGLNSDYLSRLYKSRYNVTPHAYLIKLRLNKAKTILSGADRLNYSLKKVALSCGFKDSLYFSRVFKKAFNLSPSEYVLKFDAKPKKKHPLGAVVEDDL